MREALIAFGKMLDDVKTWAELSACERRFTSGGSVEGRVFEFTRAARAWKDAQDAINGSGDEQKAIKGLLDVVQAAQWHTIDDEKWGCFDGDKSDTACGG